ncbi:MAG: hypothetical protein U9N42_03875 [Campylobacterota bacterium]|nr:hypothetical protein [Campylobacterota bacterium]
MIKVIDKHSLNITVRDVICIKDNPNSVIRVFELTTGSSGIASKKSLKFLVEPELYEKMLLTYREASDNTQKLNSIKKMFDDEKGNNE